MLLSRTASLLLLLLQCAYYTTAAFDAPAEGESKAGETSAEEKDAALPENSRRTLRRNGNSDCYSKIWWKWVSDGEKGARKCCRDGQWVNKQDRHCGSGRNNKGGNCYRDQCWDYNWGRCVDDEKQGDSQCCVKGQWNRYNHPHCDKHGGGNNKGGNCYRDQCWDYKWGRCVDDEKQGDSQCCVKGQWNRYDHPHCGPTNPRKPTGPTQPGPTKPTKPTGPTQPGGGGKQLCPVQCGLNNLDLQKQCTSGYICKVKAGGGLGGCTCEKSNPPGNDPNVPRDVRTPQFLG